MLAPTHGTLRRAVRVVDLVLGSLGMENYPDKRFIGKIARRFGRTVAAATMARYSAPVTRLYEQEHGPDEVESCVGVYAQQFLRATLDTCDGRSQ